MWMNGSRWRWSTPANARRTGNPSPSNPAGAVVTEIVFSYPGLGFILLNAVQEADYALLQGVFLVITMAVLVANLAADFVYVFLDPRTRQEA